MSGRRGHRITADRMNRDDSECRFRSARSVAPVAPQRGFRRRRTADVAELVVGEDAPPRVGPAGVGAQLDGRAYLRSEVDTDVRADRGEGADRFGAGDLVPDDEGVAGGEVALG